jgi:hypothetical protein
MFGNRILKVRVFLPFVKVILRWNEHKIPIVMDTIQVRVVGIYINNTFVTIILVTQILKGVSIIDVPSFPITTIRSYIADIEISVFEIVYYIGCLRLNFKKFVDSKVL